MTQLTINAVRFAGSMYNLPAKARRLSIKELDIFETPNRTPPLPPRNPFRRVSDYGKPQPSLPVGFHQIEPELLPKPLFSKSRTRPPISSYMSSMSTHTMEYPQPLSPIILPSNASSMSSKRSSIASTASSRPWTPATSASSAPPSRSCSMRSSHSSSSRRYSSSRHHPDPAPPPMPNPVPQPISQPPPPRTLRRKEAPRGETLRTLRAKDSDSYLQQRDAAEPSRRSEDSRRKSSSSKSSSKSTSKSSSSKSSSSKSSSSKSSSSKSTSKKSNLGLYSMDAKGVFIMH